MARQDKYERRPLDGFAARGFSAAYDEDRVRAEKELADTMAGPNDACIENAKVTSPEPQVKIGQEARHDPVAIDGRTAPDAAR